MSEDIYYDLYRNKCDQLTRFLNKIDLLERKLELCKRQRNEYIEQVVSEFHCGPNSFEDEITKTISEDDEEVENLK